MWSGHMPVFIGARQIHSPVAERWIFLMPNIHEPKLLNELVAESSVRIEPILREEASVFITLYGRAILFAYAPAPAPS